MKKNYHNTLFSNVPGSLYGNPAGTFSPTSGNVVVDLGSIVKAIEYLKRRVNITHIFEPKMGEIGIGYTLKGPIY